MLKFSVDTMQKLKKTNDPAIHPAIPNIWNSKPDKSVPKNLPNAFAE